MEKMKAITAIKRYFEQEDKIAPDGGRKFEGVKEFKSLTADDKAELGTLAAAELGVDLE